MYITLPTKDKVLWTHTSLVTKQTHDRVATLVNGQCTFQKKSTFFGTYLGLEFVNRLAPVKKLALYYKAGIVAAVFLGSWVGSAQVYKRSIQNDLKKELDGAPVWENKSEVPELDKKFFFLDDDNNFQPSLWHHGIASIEKPKRFYKNE